MAGEGPARKRGKYKLWTLDYNLPIPRTTKWRLNSQQSTSSVEGRHDPCFCDSQTKDNTYSSADSGDEVGDIESRCVDIVEASKETDRDLRIIESETKENGDQVYFNLEMESDIDGLSGEESSCYESESELETGEETGAGNCNEDVGDFYEEDNLLLYSNAVVSKLAAHVIVNLFVMEHKLSNQAMEDLIRLINILLPGGHKFVRSGYLLKRYFVNLFQEPLPKRHKYCGRCLDSIPPSVNVCNNEQCQEVNASVREFLEIDLCNQLSRLYKGKCLLHTDMVTALVRTI